MSMFDQLLCEWPLPAGYESMQGAVFQTKDLDCEGEVYTITADGNLVCDGRKILIDQDLFFDHDGRYFRARFEDGRLLGIKFIEQNRPWFADEV